jgi:peptidoglycan/xylan/chitin deacetylase (PgdA/CDA1 family)
VSGDDVAEPKFFRGRGLLVIAFLAALGSFSLSLVLPQVTTKQPTPGNIAQSHQALQQLFAQLARQIPEEFFTFSVPLEFGGKTFYNAKLNNPEKVIALTFDDGPWQKTTLEVLDILKQNNIKATFFWVGEPLQSYPQIAQEVVAEGHAIGNHTWHHWYRHMDEATATHEVEDTEELIYKITGIKTSIFRPPGGFLHNGLADYAKKHQYVITMWSVTSADTDWHAQPPAFVNNVLKGAKPGAIVLMHDGGGNHSKTVQALPQIIAGLKQQGYRFVTIPELLKIQEAALPKATAFLKSARN